MGSNVLKDVLPSVRVVDSAPTNENIADEGDSRRATRPAIIMAIAVPLKRVRTYASFVKLEHSIFSLPLIFAGAWLSLRSWPNARVSFLIVMAAVSGRVIAMGLNRLIDRELDARNPRTRGRELPSGAMHPGEAWAILGVATALYSASAAILGPICLRLSPIPVALFVIYPYLKRFTALSHLGLGLAWSMAPLGGWLAASQSFTRLNEVGWLWLFSVLWVAGFDIIYATMDEAFDREFDLHSLPAQIGKKAALWVALGFHAMAFLSLVLLWRLQGASPSAFMWLLSLGLVFAWQHALADRRPDVAFFQLNAVLGFLVLAFVLAGSKQ